MDVMEVSPRVQAIMLLASALTGVAAGLVFDLIGVFYRSLGVGGRPPYYERKLPLIGTVGQRAGLGGRVANALLACADLLFPLAWTAAQLCVFFAVDDGIFRLSGLLAGGLGFWLWRKTLGVLFRACGGFIVYGARVAAAYICFPFVFSARAVGGMLRRAASAVIRARRERRIAAYDARERKRLLTLAGAGFDAAGAFGSPANDTKEGNVKK